MTILPSKSSDPPVCCYSHVFLPTTSLIGDTQLTQTHRFLILFTSKLTPVHKGNAIIINVCNHFFLRLDAQQRIIIIIIIIPDEKANQSSCECHRNNKALFPPGNTVHCTYQNDLRLLSLEDDPGVTSVPTGHRIPGGGGGAIIEEGKTCKSSRLLHQLKYIFKSRHFTGKKKYSIFMINHCRYVKIN